MCLNECEEKNMEAASVKRVWAGILAVGILLGMSGCAANTGVVHNNMVNTTIVILFICFPLVCFS